ncbi:MAG: 16S rRNA (adenine(1518)-N(6)/adenine(1519)-N(6))-dimethyltransferase RsmA [Acidilobaceae archaeon]
MEFKPLLNRRELLKYTKRALKSLGLRPSKKLGQHFLIDPRGVRLFLDCLNSSNSRRFLEVGSGLGVLTIAVSQIAELVVAFEIHPKLVAFLAKLELENVQVIRGDGVEAASSTTIEHVYSNTPYNLSTAILFALAKNNNIKEVTLGVQLEVAERLLAKPGLESYGRLTVVTRRVFNTKMVGVLPPEFFYPKPEVYGAVVKLERKKEWTREDDAVEAVAKCLFTGKNKKVVKMMKKCFNIKLESSPLGEKRVRELSLEDMEEILKTLDLERLLTT